MVDKLQSKTTSKGHFVLLFAYMMTELTIMPLFEGSLTLGALSDLVYLMLLFYVMISIRRDALFWVSTSFFVLTLASYIVLIFNQDNRLLFIGLNFVSGAFLITVITSIVTFVLKKDVISLDSVMGGLCVYLLIGVAFSGIYINVELIQPGSFDFGLHGSHSDIKQLYDILYYYSFITLLTIGYGDVIPMSHFAQTLTVLEGVIGQFYVVFYVAVLVGMYLSGRPSDGGNSLRQGESEE